MGKQWKTILSLVLLAVFLVSTGLLLGNLRAFRQGDEIYTDAKALAASAEQTRKGESALPSLSQSPQEPVWIPAPVEEDPEFLQLQQLNIPALQEQNPQVIGWIRIPGTPVDYPLLQGEDNQFYLEHDWKGDPAYVGSIFLEYQNSPGLMDYNTVVYGHNMLSGAMFGTLHKYQSEAYREAHPYIYLVTGAGVLRYEIFSSYNAAVDSQTYALSFPQEENKRDFLIMALEYSDIDTKITPDLMDRILTLSTCNGSGYRSRRVIHARLPMIPQEPSP